MEQQGEGRKEHAPSEVLMETKSREDERECEDEEIHRKQETGKDFLL